jgi:cytochrome P450
MPGESKKTGGSIPLRSKFNHELDPAVVEGHPEVWDRFRREGRAFRSDAAPGDWNVWYLTGFEDSREAFQRPEVFSNKVILAFIQESEQMPWIPITMDPPQHTKYRRLLNTWFTPTAAREMTPQIRARCVEVIECFRQNGRCDFVAEFARLFPTTVFMKMMGLPVEEAPTFLGWIERMMHATDATDPDGTVRAETRVNVIQYLGGLIAARKQEPREDLISHLIAADFEGRKLADEELMGISFLLYMAGLDTVAGMLSYIFRHLAERPGDRKLLRDDPGKIPDAVEEFLRYYAIVYTARLVTRDVEFAGCPMRAGDRVVLATPAPSRDPDGIPNAEKFVIDRRENRHLAFGAGPHRCLGSHLARTELAVAIEEWNRRIPDYRIAEGATITQHIGGVAGLDTLPLVWA